MSSAEGKIKRTLRPGCVGHLGTLFQRDTVIIVIESRSAYPKTRISICSSCIQGHSATNDRGGIRSCMLLKCTCVWPSIIGDSESSSAASKYLKVTSGWVKREPYFAFLTRHS
jgi:hypothetical protein